MTTRNDVERDVFVVLERLVSQDIIITKEKRLIADLKLLSDDSSQMIVDLERKYHISIPPKEWLTVVTVGDTVELCVKHFAK